MRLIQLRKAGVTLYLHAKNVFPSDLLTETEVYSMKIAIIGTGRVGSALAYALVLKGLGNSLLLANRDETKALGDALDLQHTLSFCEHQMQIKGCKIAEVRACDIVVITASTSMQTGMTSRMDLGPANVLMFKELVPVLAANNPHCIFIVITNPVDIMTYQATRLSGFPAKRVMGIGTLVDSARFRAFLSEAEKIHPDDLRAYILGEHGASQFPIFSQALAGGEQIDDNPLNRKIFDRVNEAGFDVFSLKGYTNFAIASAACEVIRTIAYDEHRTMPISTFFSEWQGIKNNCFSIPVVLGREGVIRYLHLQLNQREQAELHQTAVIIKNHIAQLLPEYA
jgi:L-lactate dehydrogenase